MAKFNSSKFVFPRKVNFSEIKKALSYIHGFTYDMILSGISFLT